MCILKRCINSQELRTKIKVFLMIHPIPSKWLPLVQLVNMKAIFGYPIQAHLVLQDWVRHLQLRKTFLTCKNTFAKPQL